MVIHNQPLPLASDLLSYFSPHSAPDTLATLLSPSITCLPSGRIEIAWGLGVSDSEETEDYVGWEWSLNPRGREPWKATAKSQRAAESRIIPDIFSRAVLVRQGDGIIFLFYPLPVDLFLLCYCLNTSVLLKQQRCFWELCPMSISSKHSCDCIIVVNCKPLTPRWLRTYCTGGIQV